MKTTKIISLMASVCVTALLAAICVACDETKPDQERPFTYVKTVLGGCNDNVSKSATENNDKTDGLEVFTKEDSLHIFVGLNYICCAPFFTECRIEKDTIYMSIIDRATEQETVPYCRCSCYYTFDFVFLKKGHQNFTYKISLFDAQESASKVLYEERLNTHLLSK